MRCNVRSAARRLILSILLMLALPSVALAATDTLARIIETKTIRLGYQEDAFPFSFVEKARPVGYSIDLCQEIVGSLKNQLKLKTLNVEWVASSTASQFVLLNNHTADMMCLPGFYSHARLSQVEFSTPFYFSHTRFVTRREDSSATIEALSGHTVLVKSGTIYVEQLHKLNINNALNLNISLDNNNSMAFQEIQDGEFTALISSTVLLKGMIAQSPHPEEFALSDDVLSPPIPAGMLLPLNDEKFKQNIDEIMMTLITSSKFNAIYQKWFLSPIPPRGINLNIPMSTSLKALTSSKSRAVYHYE